MNNQLPDGEIRADQFNSLDDFNAGENIAAGDAVAYTGKGVLDEIFVYEQTSNTADQDIASNSLAQRFTVPSGVTELSKLRIFGNNGNDAVRVNLYIRDGLNGTNLFSVENFLPTALEYDISGFAVSAGDYYIVIEALSTSPRRWESIVEVGGGAFRQTTSGGTWTALNLALGATVTWAGEVFGPSTIIKASAALLDKRLNFVGFAAAAATVGNPVAILNTPFYTTTGLTVGDYYLSDTAGQISQTKGTLERLVGRAVSTTRLVRARGIVSDYFDIPTNNPFIVPTHMYLGNLTGTRDIETNGQRVEGSSLVKSGDTVVVGSQTVGRILDTGSII